MEWKKLTKKALKDLKVEEYHILVSPKDSLWPYDIINFLNLDNCGFTKKEMKNHWSSWNSDFKYEYDDDELLQFFTHYCLIFRPEETK